MPSFLYKNQDKIDSLIMSYSLKEMPAGMPSPINPVIIQARINPQKTYSDPLLSDYVAPPFSLVFSNIIKEPTPSVASQIISLKRKRDNDVLDVFTNAYKIDSRTKSGSQLKCIGVTYDGTMDGTSVKTTPDARGRIGVMVHGSTSVICNSNDLKSLNIGDEIAWAKRDNSIMFTGCPMDWSTVKLVQHLPPLGMLETDIRFDILFGSKIDYIGTPEQKQELQNRLLFLKARQGGGLAAFFGIDGITPKELVRVIAIIMFKRLDITYSDWEDVLYDYNSTYYVMASKPQSDIDMKWITDCFGEIPGEIYAKIDGTTGGAVIDDTGSNADAYYLPQSNGWFNEFLRANKKIDIYSDYKNPDVAMPTKLTGKLDTNELYTALMGPRAPAFDATTCLNATEFINLLATTTQSRRDQLYFVARKNLKKGTTFKDAGINKEELDMYMHLCKTQFNFDKLTLEQAKDLTDMINLKIVKNEMVYSNWLTSKRMLIINQQQTHENKIGTLIGKGTDYATILLNTN
jgi:hypothetical protein